MLQPPWEAWLMSSFRNCVSASDFTWNHFWKIQTWNQSIVQQLISEGNILSLFLKASPIGLIHKTTCKLRRTRSMKKLYMASGPESTFRFRSWTMFCIWKETRKQVGLTILNDISSSYYDFPKLRFGRQLNNMYQKYKCSNGTFVRNNPLGRSVRKCSASVLPYWQLSLAKLTLPWNDDQVWACAAITFRLNWHVVFVDCATGSARSDKC